MNQTINLHNKSDHDKIYKYISYVIILYCIILRCYYYGYSKFLWQDEAWLFFSLYKSNFLSVFTQHNSFFQTYPSLYGVISWININIFGTSTYVLRFVPFMGNCLFFILLYIIAKKIVNTKYAMICLAISSFNLIFLNYSDEFKQYSLEADFTIILLIYFLNNPHLNSIKYKFVSISILSMLFSVPAPFIVLSIIICFFYNFTKSKENKANFIIKFFLFAKKNIYQIILLGSFSLAYYILCLQNGDANNGNAWKNGMIPLYHTEWIEWICHNFFIILSKLLTNTKELTVGHVILICSFCGLILILKQKNPFSLFMKVFIPIFVLSLCRVYSLGNVYWGIQGARLSIYILPIFILNSGYFLYWLMNKIDFTNIAKLKYILIDSKNAKSTKKFVDCEKNSSQRSMLGNICIVLFSAYLSFWMILCINEWNYSNYKSYDTILGILNKDKNNIVVAHSSMWYSAEYYNIYKKCNLDIKKLGNQKTPSSEYPPKSIDFTPGFIHLLNELPRDKKILVFVPGFLKDKIVRFIDMSGCTIEYFNFDDFYILSCQKII